MLIQTATVFTVALAARGLHLWAMRDSVFYEVLVCDGWQYDQWAQSLAAGDWIGSEVYYQTPFYPYLLGMVYAVMGHSVWAVRLLQAVLGSLACVFAARAGAGFFSERVGWLTGLILALYAPAIFFDGIIQKASLDLVLMTGLLWVIAAAQRSPRVGRFAVAGLLLGAMTLNRENAAVLVPLLLAWTVWLSWDQRAFLAFPRALALVAGIAVVLVPVGLRNYHVGGQFLLTTSQLGPNFYIGNHATADGRYQSLRAARGDPRHERHDAQQIAEAKLGRPLSPREVSDFWVERASEDIRGNPARWVRLLAWKWFLTWNAFELVDAEGLGAYARESWVLRTLGWVLHFGVLCPLAVFGIWWTRHDWRRLWLLYAMLLAFAIAVTAFFVFARYRYPLVPVTVLFAAAGAVGAWDRIRTRKGMPLSELWAGAALATVAAVFCNWPLPSTYADEEVTHFTTGTALMDVGRMDEATAIFRDALEINPNSSVVYSNLGRAALALDQLDLAEESFRQSIKLAPNLAQPFFGLGEVLLKRRQLSEAGAAFRQAVRIEPQYFDALLALGGVELALGNLDAAQEQLRRAMAVKPHSAKAYSDLANVLIARGEIRQALDALRKAVEIQPISEAANNLAWILATCPDVALRDSRQALELAERICKATDYQAAEALDTLAAAHANAGDFQRALEWSERALERARNDQNDVLAAALEEHQKLYEQQRPFRDPALQPRVRATP